MSLEGGVKGTVLKAPFPREPYPGGKSRVADMVWERLGNPDNYVEPFMGSLAVLLRRPADHFAGGYRVETANDVNHYIVNFWRAVRSAPDEVAAWADSPVLEADLHARHKWLVRSELAAQWRKRMAEDPDHFDAKVAGWWVWGACCWIGGQWCQDGVANKRQMPQIDQSKGCVLIGDSPTDWNQTPDLDPGRGQTAPRIEQSHRGRPQLTDAFDIGRGVNGGGGLKLQTPRLSNGDGSPGRTGVTAEVPHQWEQVPLLSHPGGTGVNALPGLGTCDARRAWLVDWMRRLADRLRLVRTLYGHWDRACDSDSTMTRLGTTGVFLDPPYPAVSVNGKKSRDPNLYASDKGADLNALRDEVLAWCRKWGLNPQVRIAVCGYDTDGYEALTAEGWDEVAWSASGGYGNQRRKGKGKSANADRERIWYSPACIKPDTGANLFEGYE